MTGEVQMATLNAPAPDFTLPTTSEGPLTLSSLQGQKVILAFFPAAFTGVCQKEMCTLNDALSKLNEANARVLGISVDGPLSLNEFATQNQLKFTLLSDHQRQATHAYGVAFENFAGAPGYTVANRAVFIIDESGVLRFSWIAPNPGVEPNYDDVLARATSL